MFEAQKAGYAYGDVDVAPVSSGKLMRSPLAVEPLHRGDLAGVSQLDHSLSSKWSIESGAREKRLGSLAALDTDLCLAGVGVSAFSFSLSPVSSTSLY
jgi:hypothetical protein